MGEPGGMPGTPQRHTKLKKGFGMIFRTLFGHSGGALGDQGGDQKPPDGLEMPLQRLIEDTRVAKRRSGQPGQDFGRKKAHFQGAWGDQNVAET